MNTLYRLIFASMTSLFLLVSCETKEEEPSAYSENTIQATIGQETKTALITEEGATVSKVVWEKGDEIAVFVDDNRLPKRFKLISGEGTNNGTFSGYGTGRRYLGVYPFDAVIDATVGEQIHMVFPEEQRYKLNSFGNGNCPMIAASTSTYLSFYNLCSLVKISLKGNNTIEKIVFTSNNNDVKVSGRASICLTEEGVPNITMGEDGSNSLTLTTSGVTINDDAYTDFYIALPPQNYLGGFTITIHTPTGSMKKSINKDFCLERSRIHSATPFSLHLDEGVDPSSVLKGYGTKEQPFLIESLPDLLYMRQQINTEGIGEIRAEDGSFVPAMTAWYRMTADIDLSPVCGQDVGRDWIPIGDVASNIYYVFAGHFDGDGHSITNLYIDNEKEYQGLFGAGSYYRPLQYPDNKNKDKYNTILNAKGDINNLNVKGCVKASRYVSMIAPIVDNIVNCKTYGTVQGDMSAGITVFTYNIEQCENYAEIISLSSAQAVGVVYGSISSQLGSNVVGCRNYGDIQGTAGIAYNCSRVMNCENYGTISGPTNICGIVYYASDYAINCANYGDVVAYGNYYTINQSYGSKGGGIRFGSYGKTLNCINIGKVTAINEAYGIADYTLGEDQSQYYGGNVFYSEVSNCVNVGSLSLSNMGLPNTAEENNKCWAISRYSIYSKITNNYWLYDKVGNIGNKEGIICLSPDNTIIENNLPLTNSQAKGLDNSSILFVSEAGSTYANIVKALNAWAYEHSVNDEVEYSGWEISPDNGYPVLTMKKAEMPEPDEVAPYFELSTEALNVAATGEVKTLTISTNIPFEVSTSEDWIIEVGRESLGPLQTSISFYVKPNPNKEERDGQIKFRTSTLGTFMVSTTQLPHPDWYISLDYSKDGNSQVLQAATEGKGIDIVLMGDGFSDRQVASGEYDSVMNQMAEAIFSEEPFASYRHLFNVYSVTVVSQTEEYEHDGQALGTWYGEGTHVEGDRTAIFSYALKAVSEEKMDDALIVLAMNSSRYAGSCWMYYLNGSTPGDYGRGTAIAYASGHGNNLKETVIHEVGHGFAKLADEYSSEPNERIPSDKIQEMKKAEIAGWWKNIDFTPYAESVKWKAFLQDARYDNDGLGIFEGAAEYLYGVYRPTENSIMRNNTGGFNAPSREAIWYRIHKLAYGESWTYDYEKFVEYDKKNIKIASTKTNYVALPSSTPAEFFHCEPVIIYGNWKQFLEVTNNHNN